MRVLQVVGDFFRRGNGIYIITHEHIKELNSKGIETELLLLNPTDAVESYAIHQNITDYNNFFKNHNYDLVVFHGLFYIQYIAIAKELDSLSIPYLIRPHSSLMKVSHKKSWLKKKIAFLLYFNKFIENSYAIEFSNEEERKNSSFQHKKYFIEPNGLIINKTDFSETFFNSKNSIELLYLSRIDFTHKGVDYLIDGFKKYQLLEKSKKLKLNIYGVGKDEEMKRLHKLIDDNPDIEFHGPIFGEEKDELLKRSDILILTSRYEGFPTILIESLSKGVPTIVTPGTNAAFFEKEKIGWVADLNTNSIAKTIEKAVKEYETHKIEIKQRCVDYTNKHFDIRINTFTTISIYNEVLKNTKG